MKKSKSSQDARVELFKALEPKELDRSVQRLFNESGHSMNLFYSCSQSSPDYDDRT